MENGSDPRSRRMPTDVTTRISSRDSRATLQPAELAPRAAAHGDSDRRARRLAAHNKASTAWSPSIRSKSRSPYWMLAAMSESILEGATRLPRAG
jgi:hypothetical protein